MSLELSLDFLFELIQEYHIITSDQKIYLNKKIDQYLSLYQNIHKKEPFVTDLLMFILGKEHISLEEEYLYKLIARRAGCDYVHLDPLKIDSQIVMSTISLPYGKKHKVLPLSSDGTTITIAVANPFKMEILDQLTSTTGLKMLPVMASPKDIDKLLTDIFGFKKSIKAAADDAAKDAQSNMEQLTMLTGSASMDDKHIVKAVEFMLKYAIEQGASDIHIEPKKNETLIRFRIDGILHTIYTFPISVHLPFLSRLKMLSAMDIAEKRRSQDGRIKVKTETGYEVEIRTSTIPIVFGEKMVLRILEAGSFIKNLAEIGFEEEQLEAWQQAMNKSYGMLLVTGPTGSGKTTTLYSTLKELASPDINIVSIEDPIEIVVDEINQIGVNLKADITFSSALRHILRQDPDIVMVGEIRDPDTASNAVQASLTGHLVFSTLHTNDTATTVERLLDLGIEPFLAASVLNGIVAQRLVRKICPYCSFDRDMSDSEKILLHLPVESNYTIKDSEGCVKCRYTGHKGRVAIIELMPINEKIRSMISSGAKADELRNNAIMDGMITLRESAIRKLASGITTFDEIVKALYYN